MLRCLHHAKHGTRASAQAGLGYDKLRGDWPAEATRALGAHSLTATAFQDLRET